MSICYGGDVVDKRVNQSENYMEAFAPYLHALPVSMLNIMRHYSVWHAVENLVVV